MPPPFPPPLERPRPDDEDPPRRAPAVLRGARAAIVFLTRLPAGGFPYRDADWRWAAGWFPVAGALVGALGAAAFALAAAAGTGPLVAAVAAVITGLMVTGALHEDGLADTADALGGATDRPRIFTILKDSRIGSFGAAALVMALLLRVALLARLEAHAPAALILAATWSRAVPVGLMAALPYVTADEVARSRPLAASGRAQVLMALAWSLAAAGAVTFAHGWPAPVAATIALAAAALAGLACAWRFHARAGGITGDFLGATQVIADATILCVLVIAGG